MVTRFVRALIVAHRWLGVALAAVLLMWFASGIVMMYRSYPSIGNAERLAHLPTLDPARIRLTAAEAFAAGGPEPAFVLLSTIDDRPVYIGAGRVIFADDGRELLFVEGEMVDRAAAAWSGRPAAEALRTTVHEPDLWTLSGGLRRARPLFKYSWPDGQQVYVHGDSAEVLQYTTTASRFWSYLGAIPHWLYIPALRTRDAAWLRVMAWTSLLGATSAVLGLAIALWVYSPRRQYRHNGEAARFPYYGWKRWHTVVGLAAGVAAATWAFSGLLSLEAFGIERRLTALFSSAEPPTDRAVTQAWHRMAAVLRGTSLPFEAYAKKSPSAAIRELADFDVKELEYTALAGEALYIATDGRGETRVVPVDGPPHEGWTPADLMRRMRAAAGSSAAEMTVIDRYDRYYRDRTGALPLPVIKVQMRDSRGSRHYVEPATATVVRTYNGDEWVNRWLYHGLHSLDFPWLYNYRPLWDIVVIGFMLGGVALCMTSLALVWRLLGRKMTTVLDRARVATAAAHPLRPVASREGSLPEKA